MKLYIDSSDNLKTIIKLDNTEYLTEYSSPREQNVLGAIEDAIKIEGLSMTDISQIKVVIGPGSFTGLRVGISIANALSFALQVPVNGERPGTIITPYYGKEPSIS